MPILPKASGIVITIDYDGTPTIEVNGVTGSSCAGMTAQLEAAFGAVVSDEKKPAYNDHKSVTQHAMLRAGG